MSAYIVEHETIEKLLIGIQLCEKYSVVFNGMNLRTIDKIGNNYRLCFLRDCANKLWKLNTQSVNFRYNERKHAPKFTGPIPVFNDYSLVQIYKTFDCFLYQSCEGRFDKTNLYRETEKIRDLIAGEIIVNLPEYDSAKWG